MNRAPSGDQGGPQPGPLDPQATFSILAMLVLSGALIVTPFLRLKIGCRYLIGLPTVGAFVILVIVGCYSRTNLDRRLFEVFILTWLHWVFVRVIYAWLRRYREPVHSQYNGWPLVCTLLRFPSEGFAKYLLEPGICIGLSFPRAHQAPVFSGLLFFVGLSLFAAHGLASHWESRRTQALVDSEFEQRQAIGNFRQQRGLR